VIIAGERSGRVIGRMVWWHDARCGSSVNGARWSPGRWGAVRRRTSTSGCRGKA